MVHESPIAHQDLVFLVQSENSDLQKQLSQSVAGENVRLVTVKQSAARGGRQVDGRIVTIIIGSDVEDPVRSAQHFHAMEKDAKIILLAKSQNYAEYINQTIRFSPYLGSNVLCLYVSDKEKFDSLLRDSLKAGRYRMHIEEANSQFSFAKTNREQAISHKLINKLMDIAPLGIVFVSRAGDVLGLNREATNIFGKNEAQVLGTPLGDLFEGVERRKLEQYIARCFKMNVNGSPDKILKLERQTTNESQQVLTCIAALFNDTREAGKVLVLTINNITSLVIEKKKRKKLQENYTRNLEDGIQQHTIALNHTVEKLLEKNDELEKINKELEAFTYISSHDLQGPLRKIQLFAGRVRDKEYQNLSEKGLQYFEFMQDAAIRMQLLIEDLLTFSKVKNDGQKIEKVDLNQIIEDVKLELIEFIKEKNATVEVTNNCHVPVISFQFRQLMNNLIGNSLKYSKPDTPPHVVIKGQDLTGDELIKAKPLKLKGKLNPKQKYCYISTEDNGIGFDTHYADQIFEVFQRLHSREEYEGTGIGLAIVKKIVENHQGVITVESEPGRGTTFEIYLPVE